MSEVFVFSLELALGIFVPWFVLSTDLKRLDSERLARAWTNASFWMSIVMFGPLCIPFHFTKTRRSLFGFVLGIVWMVAAFVAIGLASSLVQAVFGE